MNPSRPLPPSSPRERGRLAWGSRRRSDRAIGWGIALGLAAFWALLMVAVASRW